MCLLLTKGFTNLLEPYHKTWSSVLPIQFIAPAISGRFPALPFVFYSLLIKLQPKLLFILFTRIHYVIVDPQFYPFLHHPLDFTAT